MAPLRLRISKVIACILPLALRPTPPYAQEFEGEMRADRRDISTRTARYVKFSAVLAAVAVVATITLVPDDAHH